MSAGTPISCLALEANMTQKELKSTLHYNPNTGIFTRNGKEAGHVSDYNRISIGNKKYLAHRLAWLYVHGYMPNIIDHINRVKSDNRISNLSDGTYRDNQRNRNISVNNTSGINGVSYKKRRRIFEAYIKIDSKHIHLGSYKTIEEAKVAREKAEKELWS